MSEWVKVISGGTGSNTRVEMPDGTLIPGITSVKWECAVDEIATMEIKGFARIEAQVNGAQHILQDAPRAALHWRKPEDRV